MAVQKVATKTGNSWQADWTDPNGTRKRKRFPTKREATEFLSQTLQAKRAGLYIDPKYGQKKTVRMLYKEWVARLETAGARGRKPTSPKTLDNYRRQYENYIEPRWGETPLLGVTYDETAAWIFSLTGMDGRPAGSATKREVALTFGRLLAYAVKLRYLASNPTKDALGHADYVPEAKRATKHTYLTMNQLLAIARCAGEYELMILTAGLAGLRWGEITALTFADLKLGERPQMAVTKAYSEVGGKLQLGATKTDQHRVVPLPRALAVRLEELAASSSQTELIFRSKTGLVLRNSLFRKRHYQPAILEAAGNDAEFPRPTFHDLRHTAVSLAIKGGANVKVVQRIAGHASATMTLDTYAGLFDDDLHDSAKRLNEALLGAGFH